MLTIEFAISKNCQSFGWNQTPN